MRQRTQLGVSLGIAILWMTYSYVLRALAIDHTPGPSIWVLITIVLGSIAVYSLAITGEQTDGDRSSLTTDEQRSGFKSMFVSKMPRKLRLLMLTILAPMLAIFFYGIAMFPDAPIRTCAAGTGYCGKQGQARTLADYEAFVRWETAMKITWPAGMLGLLVIVFLTEGKGWRNGRS